MKPAILKNVNFQNPTNCQKFENSGNILFNFLGFFSIDQTQFFCDPKMITKKISLQNKTHVVIV